MKVVGYIVFKGEKPCSFKNVIGSYRAGILVPALSHEPVAFFNKLRDANRAIGRSRAAADAVVGSVVEDFIREKHPELFDRSPFAVRPLGKQLAGLPKVAEPQTRTKK